MKNYQKYSKKDSNEESTNKEVIKETTISAVPKDEKKTAIVISPSRLNVRKEANINSKILGSIEPGTKIIAYVVLSDWSYIYVDDKLKGCVMTKYIKVE